MSTKIVIAAVVLRCCFSSNGLAALGRDDARSLRAPDSSAGRGRQDLSACRFATPSARRRVHLQPLPDGPGLRGAAHRSMPRPRIGVALRLSANDPLAVRLDELGYTDVGDCFED